VIPERAFAEARSWLAKAKQADAEALKDLEGSMGGYAMPHWAKRMLSEEILALVRLMEAEKSISGERKG
jgi:mono/diheme cytochrome c family protein